MTIEDKFRAETRGLMCTICTNKDTSYDPVTPEKMRLWAYYTLAKKSQMGPRHKTQGSTCYYCLRIWNNRFMEEYTLSSYKSELGKDCR
jgi:hypothetical protein